LKEKVIISLETQSDFYFETIFFAKTTVILKRKEYLSILPRAINKQH